MTTRRSQYWFFGYLIFAALATLTSGIKHLREHDGWTMGDWLINYHAGFVRRGLMGEVAARIGNLLHISPQIVVFLMQLVCYAVIVYVVVRLIHGIPWSLWKVAMVISPATFAFQVLGPTGFRKEMIFLAGLGILVLLLDKAPHPAFITLYLSILGVVCVLSHESLILFSVYWIGAVAIGFDSISRAIRISVIPAICMFVAFFFVMRHPGNVVMAQQICNSIGYAQATPFPEQCAGAIAYLQYDSAYAHNEVLRQVNGFHALRTYTFAGLLALLPVVLAFIALRRFPSVRRDLHLLAATALISFAATVPLFYYGADWGRWIYAHIFAIFILLLFIDHRRIATPDASKIEALPHFHLSLWPLVFLGLFATCWDLPFISSYGLHYGYVQFAAIILSNH